MAPFMIPSGRKKAHDLGPNPLDKQPKVIGMFELTTSQIRLLLAQIRRNNNIVIGRTMPLVCRVGRTLDEIAQHSLHNPKIEDPLALGGLELQELLSSRLGPDFHGSGPVRGPSALELRAGSAARCCSHRCSSRCLPRMAIHTENNTPAADSGENRCKMHSATRRG